MSEIDKTLQIMEQLRDPDSGCPWDIKQTHSSIAKCSIEESYELSYGQVVIPDKIGTGIDFNKETIKKYEYKH